MPANPSHSEVPAVVIIFSMPWNLNRHVRRVGLGLSAKIFSRNLKYSELVVGSSSCTSDSESESPVRLTVLSLRLQVPPLVTWSSSSLFKFAILLYFQVAVQVHDELCMDSGCSTVQVELTHFGTVLDFGFHGRCNIQ